MRNTNITLRRTPHDAASAAATTTPTTNAARHARHGWPSLRRGWPALCLALLLATVPASAFQKQPPAAPQQQPGKSDAGNAIDAKQYSVSRSAAATNAAALVTEFDINGLKVLVKRREGSQTVVAGLFLRGGARNVSAQNAGVEPLMLDLLSESSRNFPRQRMRAELARLGTGISYGINYDYSALTLGSTRANFDRSWEIFTDVALRPTLAPDDFERVKNRFVVGLSNNLDAPESHLQELIARHAYAGHPYLNNPQGTTETVSRLTLDDVRRFHKEAMQTSRLLLVVVGDLDAQQVRRRIAASFGALPRGDYNPKPLPQLAFATPSVEVTARTLKTNYVQGLFTAPPLTSDDIYPMRIASSILQGRVFVEVRVRRNLSYAPDAFLGSYGANTGGISVTAIDANQAVRVMLDEIARLQREPIDSGDITAQAQQYLTKYYLSQETNAAQAGELAQYELIGGGWRNSIEVLERLRAVTPADVQRVAKLYMRNIRFVVLGDPAKVDKSVFTGQTGE